jgi:peroxiredoxin
MTPKQDDQKTPVAGQPAPDFTLLNTDSAAFTLSAGLQERPLVLVFYRGDW